MSSFDITAFLDSPSNMGEDMTPSLNAGAPLLDNSFGGDLGDMLDFSQSSLQEALANASNFFPEWSSPSGRVERRIDGSVPTSMPPLTDTNPKQNDGPLQRSPPAEPTGYRAKLAAHHSAQLRSWLPQVGGGAGGVSAAHGGIGQRGLAGSYSSPSVPLSQARRNGPPPQCPTDLTIQERRRLSRRGRVLGSNAGQRSEPSDQTPALGMNEVAERQDSCETPSLSAQARGPDDSHNQISSEFVGRAYSSTGFDLIGALMRVAARPNPKIDIGPVDLSCSFTVSDARHPDQPIVHCSDTFCNLTGYSRSEVIGRNCRFLQAPNGQIEAGSERFDTDNGAVQHIKKNLSRLQECQVSLINYRRDGTPFINLVTIVPITWNDSKDPVFFVGFQVDLIEQPGAIVARKPSGVYTVNYSQSNPHPPSMHVLNKPCEADPALAAFDAAEAEASKRAMLASELAEILEGGDGDASKWARIMLENSHDIVHVLSLKGTFLYVSPSVERILGYKPEELVGKSISEFCHPSDVVPVFRELKDSTSNASIAAAARHWARVDGTVNPPTKGGAGQTGPQVNLVMRMKHKHHGHVWIENVGKLHLEQGKGRKVVISTGRQRPMYNLPWEQARRSLNTSLPGFWSKVSSNGLILGTSGRVSETIEGGSPTTEHSVPMTGKHLKDFVSPDALGAITSALRTLQVSAVPHMMSNGLGGPPQAVISTVIPSSAGGAGLPTVFLYTQRANPSDQTSMQQNAVYSQEANTAAHEASQAATLKAGEPSAGSVFGELSTVRSSSWVFELHQLKNANKRLREEVRAHQRRISTGRMSMCTVPTSPVKARWQAPTRAPTMASSDVAPSFSHSAATVMGAPPLGMPRLNSTLTSTSAAVSDSSSNEVSLSPTPFSNSEATSGSDSTEHTSVSSGTPTYTLAAGVKRARS